MPRIRLKRATAGAFIGIDPSTKRCAIAVLDGDRVRVETVSFSAAGSAAERMSRIQTGVRDLYWSIATLTAAVVVVEQPSGAQPNPMLSYAVGVTLGAVGQVAASQREPPHVEMVSSSRWKKVACGDGAIRKPKITSREPYPVLEWARAELGYAGSSWDEADALGIAEYARKTFALDIINQEGT